MTSKENYSYSNLTKGATGPLQPSPTYTLTQINYGPYEIIARIGENGRFFGIEEIRVKKSFLSPEQKIATSGYLDVDDFYRE